MPEHKKNKLWKKLISEDSAPIVDEFIVKKWERSNPELYALGCDFADSVTKAWNRLRTLIKLIFIRKQRNYRIKWKPTFLISGDLNVGFWKSSNTASPFTGQHSCLFCQKPKPVQFHLPDSTGWPFKANAFPITQYIGRHTSHDWGEKFEALADAVCDCKILLTMGKSCYIAASGDPDFPYLIVVPAFYSPKPTIH
jgi:hypothetical protein